LRAVQLQVELLPERPPRAGVSLVVVAAITMFLVIPTADTMVALVTILAIPAVWGVGCMRPALMPLRHLPST